MRDVPHGLNEGQVQGFLQGMLNRLAIGALRYGRDLERYDELATLKRRLAAAEDTRCAEYLIDVANFALLAWLGPETAEWNRESVSSSPGAVLATGRIIEERP